MHAAKDTVSGFSLHKKKTMPPQRNAGTVEKHTTRRKERAVQHIEEHTPSVENITILQACPGAEERGPIETKTVKQLWTTRKQKILSVTKSIASPISLQYSSMIRSWSPSS